MAGASASRRSEGGGIQSLERAAAILEAVASSPDGIGLAELSVRVGLHNSTAFHLVRTLATLGYVEQIADSRKYRIGSRLFMLAAGALDDKVLLSLGTPVLERLSADTGEAAHLAVRSRGEIVVIARTEATGMLQLANRTGATRPAHCTAIGKMLLSQMPDDELDRLLPELPMPAFTERTLTDTSALRAELERVRGSDIAQDDRELDADVRCIAMPVRDFAGRCIAAIGISGPVWRMADAALEAKTAQLRAAAGALSGALGGNGGLPQD